MAYSPSLVTHAQSAFNLVPLRSKLTFDAVPKLSRVPWQRQWLPASGGTRSSLVSRVPLAVLSLILTNLTPTLGACRNWC